MAVSSGSQDTRKPRRMGPEARLHLAVCGFLDVALPTGAAYYHAPAEGRRDPKSGAFLKRMGAKPGWPDLTVIHNGRVYGIELKSDRGLLTDSQSEMQALWRRCGADYAVARSVPEVAYLLLKWGLQLKAKVTT